MLVWYCTTYADGQMKSNMWTIWHINRYFPYNSLNSAIVIVFGGEEPYWLLEVRQGTIYIFRGCLLKIFLFERIANSRFSPKYIEFIQIQIQIHFLFQNVWIYLDLQQVDDETCPNCWRRHRLLRPHHRHHHHHQKTICLCVHQFCPFHIPFTP